MCMAECACMRMSACTSVFKKRELDQFLYQLNKNRCRG